MNNKDKARLIVERLNAKGADLRGVPTGIIAQVLDEIDATNDPYMPTDEEWAAHPWAKFAATDGDGDLFLYEKKPELGTAVWWQNYETEFTPIRRTTPPADFHNTLRYRPEGI